MNNLSNRQIEIIKILKNEEIVSSKNLGNLLKVSSKTIRNDINSINSMYDHCIEIKKGSGYKLSNPTLFDELATKKEDQRNLLILRKLLSKDKLNFYDLADELFISESTLTKDIHDINKIIQIRSNDVQIERKNNEIYLTGNETSRRQVCTYLLINELDEYNFELNNYEIFFEKFSLDSIKKLVLHFNEKNNVVMKDMEVLSFVMHVSIMVDRILQNKEVTLPNGVSIEKNYLELSKLFYNDLKKFLKINMSQNELNYLATLFSGKTSTFFGQEAIPIQGFVNQLVYEIKAQYEINLTKDENFINNLQLHLLSLKNRLDKQTALSNPLINDIKKHFPVTYDISVFIAMRIQEYFNVRMQESEIGFITLHLMGAIERINSADKLQILVISPLGESANSYIRRKLSHIHDIQINVCAILSIFDLEHIDMYDPDFVVSLVELNHDIKYPVYVCKELLSDHDLEKIFQMIETNKNNADFHSFFDEQLFFPDQNFTSKEEVIHFLCDKLYEQNYINDQYVNLVFKREEIAPTAYGNYFAIPHPIEKQAFKNKIAIMILNKPIDWNDNKVRLVFLFSLCKEKDNDFDRLFEKLVSLLDNMEKIKKLLKTKDLTTFLNIFNQ